MQSKALDFAHFLTGITSTAEHFHEFKISTKCDSPVIIVCTCSQDNPSEWTKQLNIFQVCPKSSYLYQEWKSVTESSREKYMCSLGISLSIYFESRTEFPPLIALSF